MALLAMDRILNALVSSGPLRERPTYDTPLDPADETAFQQWAAAQSQALGRPLLRDLTDYDLRGLYKSTNGAPLSAGHFTDAYKKPNHPTFSSESQYNKGQETGGQWRKDSSGRWSFVASPFNVETTGREALLRYFAEREPDAALVLPQEEK